MKLIVDRLDVAKTRENWPVTMPFAPAIVNKRKKLGQANWHVLAEPFVSGTAPQWAHASHDDYVRVPLFPYVLNSQADLALAFPLQVGLACASYLPTGLTHLYVATGYPVELLYDPDTDINIGLRYWFGFAVVTT